MTMLCGRPNTKRPGTFCQRHRRASAPACAEHLTDSERAEAAENRRRRYEREQALRPHPQPTPVPGSTRSPGVLHYHSWPEPRPGAGLWDWHGQRCALCGVDGHWRRLVLDHCHRTGLMRGLLCVGCNTQEGLSRAALFRAYRQRPPAVLFGHSEPYWSPLTGVAEPERWVVDQLGPRPTTPDAAAAYLRAASHLSAPTSANSLSPDRWTNSAAGYLGL